ncbi:methionyl-tRNA formyltransferase [Chryseobacterium sp. cx-311]|uniref:methionyl-tRNA formyltransferase n=1 Tax=Marnyiella aurantia TaxID=2758037 RepID=UPI001AE4D63D|nr:methionyl-tRNA formyltransferase [Marnyiella aurantia]MBP0612603.1 methionyl-tRNA formyltransferase [Marnyiella aurantia]
MKPLRTVFFGTPEFAARSLKAIHDSTHQIVGVVTVPDKASGRGQKINESPVKKYAAEHSLPVFQPEKLRNSEFLEQMKSLDADVFVVVAFRMMPKVLFELPKLGTFNLHASLLPDYRGAAPINYAIINGEIKTGITTFFINEKIDEGHILLQHEVEITPDDNAGTLHDRLMEKGAQLVVKTLDGLAHENLAETPQQEKEQVKNAFKIYREDTRINWQQNAVTIHNFVRGLSPYPCAYTKLKIGAEEKTLKIYAGITEETETDEPAGHLLADRKNFKIMTGSGWYLPLEVQLEGKKRMGIKDFLNGLGSYDNITVIM